MKRKNIASEVSGESVSAYIYDNTGLHIANHDGTITSYIKDHHGSIVGTADFNGEMVQEGNGIVYKRSAVCGREKPPIISATAASIAMMKAD